MFLVLYLLALVTAGVVKLDLDYHFTGNNASVPMNYTRFNKRGTVSDQLYNHISFYTVNIYLGSNKQKVNPLLDTGSSDFWVMTDNPNCKVDACKGMVFNPKDSTTYKETDNTFSLRYLDGTTSSGVMAQDTVGIGGVDLQDGNFGVASTHNGVNAVFGVRFAASEAAANKYDNIPVQLKNQGFINHVAYSIYLTEDKNNGGEILFGGIDMAKYTGTLSVVPMVAYDSSTVYDLRVVMHGINVTYANGDTCTLVDQMTLPVLFDTGTSLSSLPPTIIEAMGKQLGFTYHSQSELYEGQCSGFNFTSFTLDFSGTKVNIDLSALVKRSAIWAISTTEPCFLAVAATNNPAYNILGDVFLRSIYMVFDLENKEVGIAQLKNTNDEDIVTITSGIPSATRAPSYSSTIFSLTPVTHDVATCRTTSTTTSTSSTTSTPTTKSTTSTSSTTSTPTTNSTTSTTSSTTNTTTSTTTPFTSSTTSPTFNSTTSSLTSTPTGESSSNTTVSTANFSSTSSNYNGTSLTSYNANATIIETTANQTVIHTATPVVTTQVVSTFITTCSSSTEFELNGRTYTATESTVFTITDCPCTVTKTLSTAVITDKFTTTCTEPTEFEVNGKTYTATQPTVFTITDCPCTIVHDVSYPARSMVVDNFTTTCTDATQFLVDGTTYTATSNAVFTFNDCPCTLESVSAPPNLSQSVTSVNIPSPARQSAILANSASKLDFKLWIFTLLLQLV